MINKNDTVYFYYSSSHRSIQEKIASKMNKTYTPINVRVNGYMKEATQLVQIPSKYTSMYSDAKLITSGTYDEMVYTKGGIS